MKDLAVALPGSWFVANDLIPLNHRRNTNSRSAIFRLLVHTNHFAHCANENFGSSRDFGGQRKCDIELGPWTEVMVNREINAARGNIACFSVPCGSIYRHSNNDRERQIIPPSRSTLCHFPLAPDFPSMRTIPDHELGAIAFPYRQRQANSEIVAPDRRTEPKKFLPQPSPRISDIHTTCAILVRE
jgi:hypothetical protein